ncbi:serine/threonine-protein kinase haspin-like [Amblyomma americanum]
MPCAGEELSKVKFQNTLQLRSVVQQVALTIAVAEAELEFEHRALTPKHVLIKAARGRVARFCVMKNRVYVDLHGYKATVIDFGASRLCAGIESKPIYTDLDELSEDKKRGVGERLALINSIIRPNASRYHPYTNAVFLHDLIHGLLEAYEPTFQYQRSSWTEPEREAWRDLALWSEEISSCRSATDFVVARVLRSVRFGALLRQEDED